MKKGFTLVELLVAISIIAVLTAILLPNFMGARERARDSAKIQELYALKNGLRAYYNDHQSYPVGSGIVLSEATMGSYVPAIAGIGHTYYQTDSGDGFDLCVGLEAGVGDEDIDSQDKCGRTVTGVCGLPVNAAAVDKLFVICAN